VVLLLDDFAFLEMKGIEDVKRFSVCQRNFRLCGLRRDWPFALETVSPGRRAQCGTNRLKAPFGIIEKHVAQNPKSKR